MPPISSKTDKPKDAKNTFRRLAALVLEHKLILITAAILAVFGNILA